jgi:hypothetical protein
MRFIWEKEHHIYTCLTTYSLLFFAHYLVKNIKDRSGYLWGYPACPSRWSCCSWSWSSSTIRPRRGTGTPPTWQPKALGVKLEDCRAGTTTIGEICAWCFSLHQRVLIYIREEKAVCCLYMYVAWHQKNVPGRVWPSGQRQSSVRICTYFTRMVVFIDDDV